LTVIDSRYGIEPVLNKLASGGKVKAADWANAMLQLGVDEDFVARFDDKPGAHDRAEHTTAPDRVEHSGTLRRSNTTLSSRCSFVMAKTSSRRSSWGSAAREEEAPAADLRRAFGLLSRLMARRRQSEARGKLESLSDLGSEDFQGTLEVVQKARDCAQHLMRVANTRGPSAAALSPSGYAVLLLEHAAAAVQAGHYQKVHADLKGLLLLSELEPLLVVRSCIHGRPPAVQLLGWVIRSASQELLTQERDAAICPNVFGSIELGLRLCFELTKLNKSLMRPPELHHARTAPSLNNMFESLFSRRKVTDSDAVASSAATAAERLLNIVHPRTVFLALAPTAFISDCTKVECLLRPGWGLLDEALIAEPSCKVRGGLAHVAKQMGISPPEPGMKVQRLSNSSRTGLDGRDQEGAPSVTDVANAIGELEEFMGKKASMARSAALYGGAFLMQRALDQFDRTRTRRRSSTADTRRTSVILGRRDSTDSIRHSTVSGASRPSLEGVSGRPAPQLPVRDLGGPGLRPPALRRHAAAHAVALPRGPPGPGGPRALRGPAGSCERAAPAGGGRAHGTRLAAA